jgi:hypothetical protein
MQKGRALMQNGNRGMRTSAKRRSFTLESRFERGRYRRDLEREMLLAVRDQVRSFVRACAEFRDQRIVTLSAK